MLEDMSGWKVICQQTRDPKLAWFEMTLRRSGIPSRRNGRRPDGCFVLEVLKRDYQRALALLIPVDDMVDNHPMFSGEHDAGAAIILKP